ncbi:hypothetical protein [Sinorhizobium fredii]|uniref:hypothetical protein n=1 Tax=Rhizobium fredii TaxID=380 RepID=UPI0002FDDEF8|nr:hypothetical protein [Sinorhizobium fredii]
MDQMKIAVAGATRAKVDMAAKVEIKAESGESLEYLFSPTAEAEAMNAWRCRARQEVSCSPRKLRWALH